MYLLFETNRSGVRYGTFNEECELIYDGFFPLADWSSRNITTLFQTQLVPKLRAHGKLFAKIGIIVPFADAKHSEPTQASVKLLSQLGTTQLRKHTLEPVSLLLQSSQKAWPHLPHFFLFDTHLSHQLTREVVLPPYDYDLGKQLAIHPYLLHSYGHKANLKKIKADQLVISLYVDDQTSVALFNGHKIVDAAVNYSPVSSVMSSYASGAMDTGFYLELAEKKRWPELEKLFIQQAGLAPMTESRYSIDELLEIAGLVKRTGTVDLDVLSIETIEWIELSLRSYIRSLRHTIGGLMAYSEDVKHIVINASLINESSGLWKVLTQNRLGELKMSFSPTSSLQVACEDLVHPHHT